MANCIPDKAEQQSRTAGDKVRSECTSRAGGSGGRSRVATGHWSRLLGQGHGRKHGADPHVAAHACGWLRGTASLSVPGEPGPLPHPPAGRDERDQISLRHPGPSLLSTPSTLDPRPSTLSTSYEPTAYCPATGLHRGTPPSSEPDPSRRHPAGHGNLKSCCHARSGSVLSDPTLSTSVTGRPAPNPGWITARRRSQSVRSVTRYSVHPSVRIIGCDVPYTTRLNPAACQLESRA